MQNLMKDSSTVSGPASVEFPQVFFASCNAMVEQKEFHRHEFFFFFG